MTQHLIEATWPHKGPTQVAPAHSGGCLIEMEATGVPTKEGNPWQRGTTGIYAW